ncbi:MAG: cbb3-type cytochrome c oxidase subunit I, partial [Brevundimonas sp.]
WHLWIATTGLVLYIASMWVSGVMEGLMWRAYTPEGFLQYSFVETVSAKHVSNVIRLLGGLLYFAGAVIMAFNLWKTVRMPSVQAGQSPIDQLPAARAAQPALLPAE